MFAKIALTLLLLFPSPAIAQVVRMTDGEVGYKWTGFAIDEDHILTVAHADHDLAYIYTHVALIACDRVSHDRVRDIALFKCRMKHGQMPDETWPTAGENRRTHASGYTQNFGSSRGPTAIADASVPDPYKADRKSVV